MTDSTGISTMISAHDGRPCGPFTLFNRKFLQDICEHELIKKQLELDQGEDLYPSREYSDSVSKFKPMSGNKTKDKIAKKIDFTHLDESKEVQKKMAAWIS